MCDTDGNRLRRYHLQRVNDMVLAADGRTLVTVAQEHKIRLMRLHESREVTPASSGLQLVLIRAASVQGFTPPCQALRQIGRPLCWEHAESSFRLLLMA